MNKPEGVGVSRTIWNGRGLSSRSAEIGISSAQVALGYLYEHWLGWSRTTPGKRPDVQEGGKQDDPCGDVLGVLVTGHGTPRRPQRGGVWLPPAASRAGRSVNICWG